MTFAEVLSRLNPKVQITVWEKNKRPDEKVLCAKGVSVFAMRKHKVNIPKQFLVRPLTKARIFAPNLHRYEIGGREVYGWIVDREGYNLHLAKQLVERGVKIEFGHRATTEEVERASKDFDYVIGADGIAGATTWFRKSLSRSDLYLCVQSLVRLPYHNNNTVSLFFGSVAPGGYAWIFPTKDDTVFRVGLGTPLTRKPDLNNFLRQILLDGEVLCFEGARMIPTAKLPPSNQKDNILLIGDAGLFCDPLTGGGIVNAMRSAELCAKAIAQDNPGLYDWYWKMEFWLENRIRYKLKNIITKFSDEDFNVLIDEFRKYRISVRLGMDFALLQVLSLGLLNPRLAKLLLTKSFR